MHETNHHVSPELTAAINSEPEKKCHRINGKYLTPSFAKCVKCFGEQVTKNFIVEQVTKSSNNDDSDEESEEEDKIMSSRVEETGSVESKESVMLRKMWVSCKKLGSIMMLQKKRSDKQKESHLKMKFLISKKDKNILID